jgi:hypothetical protein
MDIERLFTFYLITTANHNYRPRTKEGTESMIAHIKNDINTVVVKLVKLSLPMFRKDDSQ